jgi:hypothetical protein
MKSLKIFKPTLATTLAIVLAWLLSVQAAEAGYTVTLQEVGPNVVATGSGAIDLTGLTFGSSTSVSPAMTPEYLLEGCNIYTGLPFSSVDSYGAGLNGPTSFGKNQIFLRAASSGSGDMVGIVAVATIFGKGMEVIVPSGYVSGTALSDSATYSGQTFATLGATPGTYVWTWGAGANQNFTLQIGPPTNITNISTRAFVQTGQNVMIGGFIVQGTGPKRVIIRAIGPELTQYGITNALDNPRLELHNGTGALIGSNDNWQTTILGGVITTNQVNAIQNSGYAPSAASESAIIATLQPGSYTAVVRGVGNTTGVALFEVYDLSPAASSSLSNISSRAFVQTGENVMIGGFVVQGSGPKRVIIRAIGPELTQYGITDVLANPRLELHNRSGTLIGSNDNWQTTILGGVITTNQVNAIQNSGYAPTAASESAIIANLQPGNYTAVVRGVINTTGVALVEVYDLD